MMEVWTDEKGKRVEIKTLFGHVYVDEGVEKLNTAYNVWTINGESVPSSLGKSEIEHLVARFLVLVKVDHGLVGVAKDELEKLASRHSEHWYIDELVKFGLLREKWIKGMLVVFPTEKLLINQKIPKRE